MIAGATLVLRWHAGRNPSAADRCSGRAWANRVLNSLYGADGAGRTPLVSVVFRRSHTQFSAFGRWQTGRNPRVVGRSNPDAARALSLLRSLIRNLGGVDRLSESAPSFRGRA